MKFFRTRSAPTIPRPRIRPATSRQAVLRRYRRPAAVALALLAGALMLQSVAKAGYSTVEVPVAAADLPAGHVLQSGDLRWVAQPAAEGRPEPPPHDALVGERLAIAVPAGLPVHEHLLVGPQLLTGTSPGTVAVPLRLSDPATVSLLSPGQKVNVVLTSGDGYEREIQSRTLAQGLTVLWVPASAGDDGFGLLPATGGGNDTMIVVAATAGAAEKLSAASSRGKVAAVIVN